MVRTDLKKSRYLLALVLTVLIFSFGVLVGYALTTSRINFTQSLIEQQRFEYDSLQLQYSYLAEFLQEDNCPAAVETLDQNLNNLEVVRIKLESYLEKDDQERLKAVKRDYTLAELRYWLLFMQAKKICGGYDVMTLLYFYSSRGCDACESQGAILTSLKSVFKDKLLIFSIDSSFEQEPMVNILKESFDITTTPSLVIGDEVIKEFTKKEDLKEILCSKYKEPIEACK